LLPLFNKLVLQFVLGAALVTAGTLCLRELVANWDAVADVVPRIGWLRCAAALMLSLVGFTMLPSALLALYRDLAKAEVNAARLFSAYFIANLLRYIPGKVLTLVYLVREGGAERPALTLAALITVSQSLILGALAAVVLASKTLELNSVVIPAITLSIVIAPLLHPRVNHRVVKIVASRWRRIRAPERPYTFTALLGSLGRVLIGWFLIGLSVLLLAQGLREFDRSEQLACLLSYPAAFSIGFVAFVAPGGIGIREGVLVIVFTQVVPLAPGSEGQTALAIALALLHRVLVILTDCGLFAVGALLMKLPKHRETANDRLGTDAVVE